MFESEGHAYALWRGLNPWRAGRSAPLIIVACWLTDLLLKASPSRRRVYRWMYRHVDAIVVFSENQRELLAELLDRDPTTIHVVPFGIDTEPLLEYPSEPSGSPANIPEGGADPVSILAVGRDLGRDWETFFEAVRGTGWRVEVITRPEVLDRLALPAEVTVTPTVDRSEYLRRLSRADVVAITTHEVAYPTGQTVLIEAMALGRPIVATATRALAEYFEDEENALGVSPGDAVALREAIHRLMIDPELRGRLGDAARVRAASLGDAQVMWTAVAPVIRGLADDVGEPR
jgi:glycosyltransferase involved in cell wall biosynthesis